VYNPTTAADYVYQGMRLMLMTGELQPGDRLVQRELAERFGTSHYPVIEATRRLEQDGLIISHVNRGAQVPAWTRRDAEGAFLAREALEGIAARFFAERASEAAKKQLVVLGKNFDKTAKRGDAQGWCEADVALHLHIIRSADSRALQRSIESACTLTLCIHNSFATANRPGVEPVAEEGLHLDLIEALNSGDPVRAEEAARQHVRVALAHAIADLN
jgi:DNA-binding GntR family transcriptional regulator